MDRELICFIVCFIVGIFLFYLLKQSCGCQVVEGSSNSTNSSTTGAAVPAIINQPCNQNSDCAIPAAGWRAECTMNPRGTKTCRPVANDGHCRIGDNPNNKDIPGCVWELGVDIPDGLDHSPGSDFFKVTSPLLTVVGAQLLSNDYWKESGMQCEYYWDDTYGWTQGYVHRPFVGRWRCRSYTDYNPDEKKAGMQPCGDRDCRPVGEGLDGDNHCNSGVARLPIPAAGVYNAGGVRGDRPLLPAPTSAEALAKFKTVGVNNGMANLMPAPLTAGASGKYNQCKRKY